jgi:D-tagatose-1,6-bisphosphate aldolase subunit GatZ/KbaZ
MHTNFLDEVIRGQKRGEAIGVTSICSAHPYVLRTAMRRAVRSGGVVLLESTCNQVNQHGGYTGMTPRVFYKFVHEVAEGVGLPKEKVILGGDHLGPLVWKRQPAAKAMQEATKLVRECVLAGYAKIHLDASMPLEDDPPSDALDPEIMAGRAAALVRAAEEAHTEAGDLPVLRYVIGTEVPPPGGAKVHEDRVQVTSVDDVRQTIESTRRAFAQLGLHEAWDRVMAVVVQPGVEFGDDFVLAYDSQAVHELSRFIEGVPGLIFEAHSTDYQPRLSLQSMVRDHFAVLKVGPALTFAFREMIFVLASIENELLGGSSSAEHSNIVDVLDSVMREQPEYWHEHYRGTSEAQAYARKYSLSDRLRYYWTNPTVQSALERLMKNLSATTIPLELLSQSDPTQSTRVREGILENSPGALIADRIDQVLEDYETACHGLDPEA